MYTDAETGTDSIRDISPKKSPASISFISSVPAPDIWVSDGPSRCEVYAWYPDDTVFDDADTGVDDFAGYRVYRKEGRPDVNMPDEVFSFGYLDWQLVGDVSHSGAVDVNGQTLPGTAALGADHYNAEITFRDGSTRRVMQFLDNNVSSGTPYYYAVSAYDKVYFTAGEAFFDVDTAAAFVGFTLGGVASGATETEDVLLMGPIA